MRVLTTGGVKGLGRAFVQRALGEGAQVTVLDMDADGLAQLSGSVTTICANLADPANMTKAMARLKDCEPFDLVLMNAGMNVTGPFELLSMEQQARVIAVNLTAPMQLTTALLQAGKLARGGRLVFISSLSHFVAYPGASTYAGTKDGLTVFARSLRRPLRRSVGVRVQVVAPGPMDTDHAAEHSPTPQENSYRIAPTIVADSIWRSRWGFMIIPGAAAMGASLFGRLLPTMAGNIMRRTIFEKLQARAFAPDDLLQ